MDIFQSHHMPKLANIQDKGRGKMHPNCIIIERKIVRKINRHMKNKHSNNYGIIFDLDGTLLDTLDDIADVYNRFLKEHAMPGHPTKMYKHFVGNGAYICAQRVLPEKNRDKKNIDECYQFFKSAYAQTWHNKTKPYDGIIKLLNELEKKGIPLSILSNKPHDFVIQCVDYFFPKQHFTSIMGDNGVNKIKPDPTAALELAKIMAITTEHTYFVGDSGVDMRTAKNAKMIGVGVLWGFRTKEELLKNGAKVLISQPEELLSII